MAAERVDHEVAVVGYGPTGATLAGLLARSGIAVGVYDKSREVFPQPRAVGFDHDSMRIFQRVGVADALGPHIAPFRDGIYVGTEGQIIQRVHRVPQPYPLTWAPNYSCDQPGMEAVLRAELAKQGHVEVGLGCELMGFADEGDRVRLDLRRDDGSTFTRHARYLVACDGASSPVRRSLGIAHDNLDYDAPWIVVDVLVRDEHLARLPQTNVQYCQPERPSTLVNCPGNHRRWEFMVLHGEPMEGDLSEERLWKLLARWLKPGEATIWRAAAYRFHALVAREWRRGRVLLAGDAAHQTPPFLGQGMCQGLRDTGNLDWKLAAVLRGRAPDSLLDTYGEERRPHVIETTRIAKEFGRIISERDPAVARERDRRMLEGLSEPRTIIRQELIPGLTSGLIAPEAPLAGKVFPQPRVHDAEGRERLFDDLTEPAWRLVLTGELARAPEALTEAARQAGASVICLDAGTRRADALAVNAIDPSISDFLGQADCIGAVVRPDHYVFGAFTGATQAAALLQNLAGRAH